MNWKMLFGIIPMYLFSVATFAMAEPPGSETLSAQHHSSFIETVEESLFGDPTGPWRPLPLSTFFSEGWDEPFDYPVDGSGGAPRQGWINALDGVFYRLWFLSYSHTRNLVNNGNQDIASYTLFAPINRRFQFRFDVPFFVSNRVGPTNSYNNNFGDVVISPRFLLSESQDVTHILAVPIRTPTGKRENGNDVTSITPQYEFWANVYKAWVVRGGIGTTFPIQTRHWRYTFNYNIAVGTYLTAHDRTPFGDFTVYVAGDGFKTIDDRAPDVDFFSLTPGFRSHVGRDWYLLGGVEVPLTGPNSASFDVEPNVWVMKVF